MGRFWADFGGSWGGQKPPFLGVPGGVPGGAPGGPRGAPGGPPGPGGPRVYKNSFRVGYCTIFVSRLGELLNTLENVHFFAPRGPPRDPPRGGSRDPLFGGQKRPRKPPFFGGPRGPLGGAPGPPGAGGPGRQIPPLRGTCSPPEPPGSGSRVSADWGAVPAKENRRLGASLKLPCEILRKLAYATLLS